jgi:hypothetical protein
LFLFNRKKEKTYYFPFSSEEQQIDQAPRAHVDVKVEQPEAPPPPKATIVVEVNQAKKKEEEDAVVAEEEEEDKFVFYQPTYSWKRSENVKSGRAGKPKGKPKRIRQSELDAAVAAAVEEEQAEVAPEVPVVEPAPVVPPVAPQPVEAAVAAPAEVVVEKTTKPTTTAYLTEWKTYKDNDVNRAAGKVGLRYGKPYKVTPAREGQAAAAAAEEEEEEPAGEAAAKPAVKGKKKKFERYKKEDF